MSPSLVTVLAIDLAVLIGVTTLLWLVSLKLRDASIVDIFWGLGFVITAWLTRLQLEAPSETSIILPIAATLWGLRLSLYLGKRNLAPGHGQKPQEDKRYAAMRAKRPDTFARWSLFAIFWFQGVLCLIVALPLVVGQWAPRPAELPAQHPLELIGFAIFLTGLTIQAIADQQLARFKRDPASQGQVMDQGLWRYSRHPNYFGEALLWWGVYIIVLPIPDARWTVIGPLLITVLLLKVSGVALLEKTIVDRRPNYADYIKRTSAFIPWPPRRDRSA